MYGNMKRAILFALACVLALACGCRTQSAPEPAGGSGGSRSYATIEAQ